MQIANHIVSVGSAFVRRAFSLPAKIDSLFSTDWLSIAEDGPIMGDAARYYH